MKKIGVLICVILLGAVFFTGCTGPISPDITDEVVIYEFYGATCPHCKSMNAWFEEIQPKYPNLRVEKYEVYKNASNRAFFEEVAQAYGHKSGGVPTIFIGEKRMVGFSKSLGDRIELEIKNCLNSGCISPQDKLTK